MKEPHIEELATRDDPESSAHTRKDTGEALTGAHAGRVLSREIKRTEAPTLLSGAKGNTTEADSARIQSASRGRRPHACGTFLRENREIPPSLSGRWLGGPQREGQ